MDRKIPKTLVLMLLTLFFVGTTIAQDSTTIVPSNNFRVTVSTNKTTYHNRDLLRLTVQLLNDSPSQIRIIQLQEPIPLPIETDEVVDAVLDDDAVDAVVRPYWPTIIGYARLTPLDYDIRTMTADGFAPEIAYRLPLFGSPVILPHSTRIISTANIWIGYPVIEPQPVPEPADVEKIAVNGERIAVDCVGKYYAVGPGRYLLEVNIDKIGGVRLAQAQRIVVIRRRPVSGVVRILRDNNAAIKRVEANTKNLIDVGKRTYSYVMYNNKYIRAIYRILTGGYTTDPNTDGATTTKSTRIRSVR